MRLERYVKDMLIELHTLREIVDTMVLPSSFQYAAMLVDSAASAKSAGIKAIPQLDAANEIGKMIQQLQTRRAALAKVIDQAEGMHDALEKQAKLLTSEGADRDGRGARECRHPRADGERRTLAAAEVPGDALPGVTRRCFTRANGGPSTNSGLLATIRS